VINAEQKPRWGKLAAVKAFFRDFRIGHSRRAMKEMMEMVEAKRSVLASSKSSRRHREAYLARLGVKKQGCMEPRKRPASCQQLCLRDGAPRNHTVSPEEFRVSYLRKLSYNKVWIPQALQPPRQRTLIIFDWDDTLLCRKYVEAHDKSYIKCSTGLAHTAKQLLECARQMGQTVIVTNGAKGWVERSAGLYLPNLVPVLQSMKVISARSKWELSEPVSQWKVRAFTELQTQLSPQTVSNFISIGDSSFERDAARIIGATFPNAIVKTVKLLETPSPEELLWQQELVLQKLPRIVSSGRNKEVDLKRKQHHA